MRALLALAVLLASPLSSALAWADVGAVSAGGPVPAYVLWAWSTSDDLGFLAAGGAPGPSGVAYLSGEVIVDADGVHVSPRWRSLRLPRGVERTAVVYVAVTRRVRAPLTDAAIGDLARRIRALPLVRDAARVQLNFEATASRRGEWQALVTALRAALPATQQLDVTALADWCMDARFEPAGVDRVVPMLYRLGSTSPALRRVLAGTQAFPAAACDDSVGIATDELDLGTHALRAGRRWVYVFAPTRWTPEHFAEFQTRLARAP